jgi:tetratricopeptide (TPR) repeat protein
MNVKLAVSLAGFLAFCAAASAQGTKGGSSTPAAGSGTVAPSDPSKLINSNWSKINKGRAGDYLSGSVEITNGALPWDPIPVTIVCDGQVKYTTRTDGKGIFIIAPADTQGSTTVKADPKPVSTQFIGCDVRATLPGFDSSDLKIANRAVTDSTNIGTIKLTQEAGASGTAVSATTASAPKEAAKSFEKARSALMDNKPDKAQHELQKAVDAYPQFAEAWYQMGKIQEQSNQLDAAANSYNKACAADPKFVPPYERIAIVAAQKMNWQQVLDATNHELELNSRGTAQVWYYNALGNFQLQKADVAEESAKKSLAMDPLHEQPLTEQLLAVILAQKQDYAGALAHLKNCLTYFPPGPNLDLVKQQIAQLEPAVQPPK